MLIYRQIAFCFNPRPPKRALRCATYHKWQPGRSRFNPRPPKRALRSGAGKPSPRCIACCFNPRPPKRALRSHTSRTIFSVSILARRSGRCDWEENPDPRRFNPRPPKRALRYAETVLLDERLHVSILARLSGRCDRVFLGPRFLPCRRYMFARDCRSQHLSMPFDEQSLAN